MAKKSSGSKYFIIALLLLVAGGATWFFVFKKDDPRIVVKTGKVERRTITQKVNAIGKIQPETEVKISSEISGELVFLGAKEGDTVKVGQVLARVKPDIIETQLEQFKASADAAKTDIEFNKASQDVAKLELDRLTELFKKNFAAKQQVEQAKATYDRAVSSYQSAIARYEQARASYRQILNTASRTTIYSPINGIVTSLLVEVGEKVLGTAQFQGTELMKVSDLEIMNAIVDVGENEIVKVKIGDTARVNIDAFANRIFTGTVIEIGHSAIQTAVGGQDQVTNFAVKVRMVDVDNKMRPGMSCDVNIETLTVKDVLSLPLQAVTVRTEDMGAKPDIKEGVRKASDGSTAKNRDPKPVVFIAKDGIATMQPVKVGISDRGFIEVSEGVEEGQEIITGNFQAVSKDLFDGAEIKVDTTSTGFGVGKGKRGGARK